GSGPQATSLTSAANRVTPHAMIQETRDHGRRESVPWRCSALTRPGTLFPFVLCLEPVDDECYVQNDIDRHWILVRGPGGRRGVPDAVHTVLRRGDGGHQRRRDVAEDVGRRAEAASRDGWRDRCHDHAGSR